MEFIFDNSPLLDFAESLQPAQPFSAEQFLTLAAREDRETVEHLAAMLREGDVSPLHVYDIVCDFVAEL